MSSRKFIVMRVDEKNDGGQPAQLYLKVWDPYRWTRFLNKASAFRSLDVAENVAADAILRQPEISGTVGVWALVVRHGNLSVEKVQDKDRGILYP